MIIKGFLVSLPLFTKQKIKCPHFDQCSGCLINEVVDNPAVIGEAQSFFSKRGIAGFKVNADKPERWRYRAKLAVQGTSRHPLIGLYKEGSHDVIDIPLCRVHHQRINQAVEKVREMIIGENIIPYNELRHSGDLRYLQIVVERSTSRVQLSFVFNAVDDDPRLKHWLNALEKLWRATEKGFWHSFWLNYNPKATNVIFGPKWIHVFGDSLLWECFQNVGVCFQPASFAQANLDLFEKMLASIANKIPKGTLLGEFYAGVGVIGLTLAHKCSRVLCLENNPFAEECFNQSKATLSLADSQKIAFQVEKASESAKRLDTFDTAIVDPPRKGLDSALLKALIHAQNLQQLIYISCGWMAFQRDCDALLAAGWHLIDAEGYLFFPGSNYIEILAQFNKK